MKRLTQEEINEGIKRLSADLHTCVDALVDRYPHLTAPDLRDILQGACDEHLTVWIEGEDDDRGDSEVDYPL